MLTEKIVHECIKRLLADTTAPKQQDLECLSKLMLTVGRQLNANPSAKMQMDVYFQRIDTLRKDQPFESKSWSMLQANILFHC